MSRFKEGLYDQLVTKQVRDSLGTQAPSGVKALIAALEENDCPE